MKTEQLLIRVDLKQLARINEAFKQALINHDGLITRSEFIRQLIDSALEK